MNPTSRGNLVLLHGEGPLISLAATAAHSPSTHSANHAFILSGVAVAGSPRAELSSLGCVRRRFVGRFVRRLDKKAESSKRSMPASALDIVYSVYRVGAAAD